MDVYLPRPPEYKLHLNLFKPSDNLCIDDSLRASSLCKKVAAFNQEPLSMSSNNMSKVN